jgi:hypothetical protein
MTSAATWSEAVWRVIGREAADYGPQRESRRPDPPRYPGPGADAAEHEVRGLLHLVGLTSYCLRHCAVTEGERARWQRDAERATERLDQLRAAGWCPELLQ